MRTMTTIVIAVLVCGMWVAAPASAQPLGSFRWQLQPYCNIITVAVVQQGGQYQLDGQDDQCGAEVKASVVGLAFQNPDGSIGLGLTIVSAPGGAPVHVDATIAIATLSGTWRDSSGNSGTFIFTPAAGVPGAPRPVLIVASRLAAAESRLAALEALTTTLGASLGSIASRLAAAESGLAALGTVTTRLDAEQPAAWTNRNNGVSIGDTDTTVVDVVVTAPAAGNVMVFSTTTVREDTLGEYVACSITSGTAFDTEYIQRWRSGGPSANDSQLAGVRVFAIGAGQTVTYRLVCKNLTAGAAANVFDPTIAAIFTPAP